MSRLFKKATAQERERADELMFRYIETGRSVALRNRLVEMYQRLVFGCAYRLQSKYRRVDVQELMSAAQMGLLHAIEHYDPTRAKFATYAIRTMNEYVRNEFGYGGEKLERSKRVILSYVSSASVRLMQQLGHRPTLGEIVAETARRSPYSERSIFRAIRAFRTKSLNSMSGHWLSRARQWESEEDQGEFSECLRDRNVVDPLDHCLERERTCRNLAAKEKLRDRVMRIAMERGDRRTWRNAERNVAIFWARMADGEALETLARRFGITRERIRQICVWFLKSLLPGNKGVRLLSFAGRDPYYGRGVGAKLRRIADHLRRTARGFDEIADKIDRLLSPSVASPSLVPNGLGRPVAGAGA